jgi:hypothetical protein
MRIDESREAEYRSCLEGEYISRVIAAEWPRSVSCGSTSVVGRALPSKHFDEPGVNE